ncbi:methyltransferase domain-containing protein [Alsobacter sp. KACC 23698]|uniref:Methyltransferase domain-containing protein n=1 Tax=Alsobacter sp. KACC 23698 TaxID=3149229 RepID=A0AAU7JB90_9HYPH
MRCNLCGGNAFSDMPKRPKVRCESCGSLERTRLVGLHVQERLRLQPGARILHFAPERGLAALLRGVGGRNYEAADIEPGKYPGLGARHFDLCRDVFDLPRGTYDLIVHNHVLEHIRCSYTVPLVRLAQALKPDGVMLFTMPILPGGFSEELVDLPAADMIERFGPMIHVRRFAPDFIHETIGMIFRIPARYDATERFNEATLRDINLPEHHWRSWTGASVFEVRRSDLRV